MRALKQDPRLREKLKLDDPAPSITERWLGWVDSKAKKSEDY
jgi:hypothetical protein